MFSNTNREYITVDFFGTQINWTDFEVNLPVVERIPRVIIDNKSSDYGNENTAFNISEARNKAQLKAREKISLQIVRSIETIRIDDESTIIKKIQSDEFFRERINEFFQLEKSELKITYIADRVNVDSVMKLKGKDGLLSFLPIEYGTEDFPEISGKSIVKPVDYTGLIVDARHLEAEPSLLPRIVTERGLDIYSYHFVNKNHAIDKGLVSFQTDPKAAMESQRVGKNPYYVLALTTVGRKKTGFSLSTEDSMKLLASHKTRNSLKKCNVIILLPEKQ